MYGLLPGRHGRPPAAARFDPRPGPPGRAHHPGRDRLLHGGTGTRAELSDNTAAPARYRYNPGTWSISRIDGNEFLLGSINLYHYRYDPPEVVSDCIGPDLASRSAQEGPYLHSLSSLSDRTQPPHSNAIATRGRNTGTVRLLLSAENDNRITVVVKE